MGGFTLVLVLLLFLGGIFVMMHDPARSPLDLVRFGVLIVALFPPRLRPPRFEEVGCVDDLLDGARHRDFMGT